jgi:hypothetical protein
LVSEDLPLRGWHSPASLRVATAEVSKIKNKKSKLENRITLYSAY